MKEAQGPKIIRSPMSDILFSPVRAVRTEPDSGENEDKLFILYRLLTCV